LDKNQEENQDQFQAGESTLKMGRLKKTIDKKYVKKSAEISQKRGALELKKPIGKDRNNIKTLKPHRKIEQENKKDQIEA